MKGATWVVLLGLALVAPLVRSADAGLTLENDALAVTIDPRTASIATVVRKRADGGPQSVPIVTSDFVGLRIPVGTWDGHTVSSRQAAGFKVGNRTANALTLAATRFRSDAGTFPISLRIHYWLD